MNAALPAGILAGVIIVSGCSTINPDQERANTIAKAQAECERHGKKALIDDVHQEPDGKGGIYTTVRSRCIPPSAEPST
jgi:hypothetical protein